ncbi:four helix bundle protein [Mucilaginibacter achroorhodeus]|uniref:Four helix bundle protein n=1 Tax=Mucilaginibacter achroorhodeus TaxID=2599294 RepID=A0A563UAK8_9SPHI|nr:four helix bundle protein [Mucilaginibacter achroorhodeus]TWR28313.1 four helix bundle protein [Mucilaginibacter achroorhodeus]
MASFTDLDVWKKARLVRNNITEITREFPVEEKYRLVDQIIRSSRSIGNNIAEGHGRFHYLYASKFLITARGSSSETIDHLIIALDNNLISVEMFDCLKADCEECSSMINGYISYLNSKA